MRVNGREARPLDQGGLGHEKQGRGRRLRVPWIPQQVAGGMITASIVPQEAASDSVFHEGLLTKGFISHILILVTRVSN